MHQIPSQIQTILSFGYCECQNFKSLFLGPYLSMFDPLVYTSIVVLDIFRDLRIMHRHKC